MSTEELPQSIDPTDTAPMADTEPQTTGWQRTLTRAPDKDESVNTLLAGFPPEAAAANPAPRTAF